MPPKKETENREELLQRLRDKRAGLREPKKQVSEKEYKKAMSTLNTELKKVNEDPRVTLNMKTLYQKAITTYDKIKIPSPIELLNNIDDAKRNYLNYINNLIEKCKKENISREQFVDNYLNSLYTQYYVEVLGLEVVPEKLRNLVKSN